jgi:SAM-dependent methyltransferase
MQFDFGSNWIAFSRRALTPEKVELARRDFTRLLKGIDLKGKSFLDIGFGQGLSLLLAQEAGAHVFGNDINPKCRVALANSTSLLNRNRSTAHRTGPFFLKVSIIGVNALPHTINDVIMDIAFIRWANSTHFLTRDSPAHGEKLTFFILSLKISSPYPIISISPFFKKDLSHRLTEK